MEWLDKKLVQTGCYIMWNLWTARNKFVCENSSQPMVVVSQLVVRQVEEFKEYTTHIYGGVSKSVVASSSRWIARLRPLLESSK